jgi:hypothetical protein
MSLRVYHVTDYSVVKSIFRDGILPFDTTNHNHPDIKVYRGRKYVFAFRKLRDARWFRDRVELWSGRYLIILKLKTPTPFKWIPDKAFARSPRITSLKSVDKVPAKCVLKVITT